MWMYISAEVVLHTKNTAVAVTYKATIGGDIGPSFSTLCQKLVS
jgi:hypothetical protein